MHVCQRLCDIEYCDSNLWGSNYHLSCVCLQSECNWKYWEVPCLWEQLSTTVPHSMQEVEISSDINASTTESCKGLAILGPCLGECIWAPHIKIDPVSHLASVEQQVNNDVICNIAQSMINFPLWMNLLILDLYIFFFNYN